MSSAPRAAAAVPNLHLSAASAPMSLSPPNSGRREVGGHHHSNSSVVMADPFEFVSATTSELDHQVMITFRRFASHTDIAGLTTHLTPLKDESDTLKQIRRSKSALESQTKWWLVEAGVIMGNAIFNKFYEEWTTVAGFDLADIACTGLGLHMSVSLSSVNSSYFAEVSDSHKKLFTALQGQYTKLGECLLEYLIKADMNYKVRKEFRSQRPDNIRKIKALAEAVEKNLDRIGTALTDAYSKPLQPKGWWGKTVSLIAGLFIKTSQTNEIQIALPLRMAILVAKRKASDVVMETPREAVLHRAGNSDPDMRSPQAAASAIPIGLSHEETVHFHNMEAFYERRKLEILRRLDERQTHSEMRMSHHLMMTMVCCTMSRIEMRRPSTVTIEEVADEKDGKACDAAHSAELGRDIEVLRRRLNILQKGDPSNKVIKECLAKLQRIASDDKSKIVDLQPQMQELREEIAALSSAAFSVQVLKMDGQASEGAVDGAGSKAFQRKATDVQHYFLGIMERGFAADQKAGSKPPILLLQEEIASLKERLQALAQIATNTTEIVKIGARLDTIVQQIEDKPNLKAVKDEIANVRENIAAQTRQMIVDMQRPEKEEREAANRKVAEQVTSIHAQLKEEIASLRKRVEGIHRVGGTDHALEAKLIGIERLLSTVGVEADARLPSLVREVNLLKLQVAKNSAELLEQLERNIKFHAAFQEQRMQLAALNADRARDRSELLEVVTAGMNSIGGRVDALAEHLFTHEARLVKQRHYEARESEEEETRAYRPRVLALAPPSPPSNSTAAAPSAASPLSARTAVVRPTPSYKGPHHNGAHGAAKK